MAIEASEMATEPESAVAAGAAFTANEQLSLQRRVVGLAGR